MIASKEKRYAKLNSLNRLIHFNFLSNEQFFHLNFK